MAVTSVKLPLANMTFTPDVPSAAQGPREYNSGYNVETDVRGIRSVSGDNPILASVPGVPNYISGGYRADGNFWFIVATDDTKWFAAKDATGWTEITPPGLTKGFTNVGYTQATNITEWWNGTVPFFNDTLNPPMFWGNGDSTMTLYSNTLPFSISTATPNTPTTNQVTLTFSAQTTAPFSTGQKITISNTGSNYWDGTFTVVSCTTSSLVYSASPGGAFPDNGGTVSPAYSWNYNPAWSSVTAGFMRLYSTPNVGSILVAGDLTAVLTDGVTVQNYPVTVQWSQSFGLNQAPITWTPTITNVANQLEVPLRGVCVDAFPSNGQFFLMSYWDTVVFSPINYAATNLPILGVRLYQKDRGMLTSNCWAVADQKVYGLDSRDIWVFDGTSFTGIGNQRVKNYFYENLNPLYQNRTYMETNTHKNQIEIYFADLTSSDGGINKMLSYRYDIDCWNSPRDVDHATFATESPVFTANVPAASTRCVTYARSLANVSIAQKDQGYTWANGSPISSQFRRDNIKLLPNYDEHIFVHRILPEASNLDTKGLPVYPSTGNLQVTVEGALSVGNAATASTTFTMPIATDYPWVQIDQNESRVNTIILGDTGESNTWMCTEITWQVTKVEDDR